MTAEEDLPVYVKSRLNIMPSLALEVGLVSCGKDFDGSGIESSRSTVEGGGKRRSRRRGGPSEGGAVEVDDEDFSVRRDKDIVAADVSVADESSLEILKSFHNLGKAGKESSCVECRRDVDEAPARRRERSDDNTEMSEGDSIGVEEMELGGVDLGVKASGGKGEDERREMPRLLLIRATISESFPPCSVVRRPREFHDDVFLR